MARSSITGSAACVVDMLWAVDAEDHIKSTGIQNVEYFG